MKVKVFWSVEEIDKFMAAFSTLPSSMTLKERGKQAQVIAGIAEHRRRDICSNENLFDLELRRNALLAHEHRKPEVAKPEVAKPVEPTTDFLSPIVAALSDHISDLVMAAVNEILTSEDFIESLKARITIPVQQIKERAMSKTDPKKPRVLVVGLLPVQAGDVAADYHEVFDLRFSDKSATASTVQSQAKYADHVLVMGDYISHSLDSVLKKHHGYCCLHGSFTTLKNHLMELV